LSVRVDSAAWWICVAWCVVARATCSIAEAIWFTASCVWSVVSLRLEDACKMSSLALIDELIASANRRRTSPK